MKHKQRQEGFSLVELMVVAIIVAILATVTVSIMSGNRRRAWATEAQTGCGSVRTALRVILADRGQYPIMSDEPIYPKILGLAANELDGTYFITSDYRVTSTPSNYVITCTGSKTVVAGGTVILDSDGAWSGTLLQ